MIITNDCRVKPVDVLVFRTNIQSAATASPVADGLDRHKSVRRWTIDYGDSDRVLRVESQNADAEEIRRIVLSAGFACEELE